jgi:hypothetical protein
MGLIKGVLNDVEVNLRALSAILLRISSKSIIDGIVDSQEITSRGSTSKAAVLYDDCSFCCTDHPR